MNKNAGEISCPASHHHGPCRGSFTRYYYDPEKDACKMFTNGGCLGNSNNFESLVQTRLSLKYINNLCMFVWWQCVWQCVYEQDRKNTCIHIHRNFTWRKLHLEETLGWRGIMANRKRYHSREKVAIIWKKCWSVKICEKTASSDSVVGCVTCDDDRLLFANLPGDETICNSVEHEVVSGCFGGRELQLFVWQRVRRGWRYEIKHRSLAVKD